MAQAASGEPTRLLTLTVNPAYYTDPEERLRKLAWAWRTTVKRRKREYGKASISYLSIVEETKRGEPHLHILLRSPYIPHALISACMAELINSPIVDIRLIRNPAQAIQYVLKYITKAPAQFDGSKRYWMSQDYEQHDDTEKAEIAAMKGGWDIWKMSIHEVERALTFAGYTRLKYEDDTLYMAPGWQLTGLELAKGQYSGEAG